MLLAHLDFKGVLPRAEYLPVLLHDLAALGYDGVLVEYEDIFPFESTMLAVGREEIWTRIQLQNFLTEAAKQNLQVVPLQQTLGHLEYALRWNVLRELALNKAYPSTIDITREQPKAFVRGLLREILEAHPDAKYVHLGMDEAHALVEHARESGADVVTLFLDYLEELCVQCEEFGVKPVIWSDMLEDHFSIQSLERFRAFAARVVLCSWDYEANGASTPAARINGTRVSKWWIENPTAPGAPVVSASTRLWEDLDDDTREFFAPYFDGENFASLFWCDVWTQIGFEVWGASASRTSGDGALLPYFNQRANNVQTWSAALKRSGARTQLVTSWARGTTFCPPIFPFDATWFALQEAARAEGKNPTPFFEGLEEKTVARIFQTLGKCREDWRLEISIADEMDALEPQLKTHALEWRAVSLLARVLAWRRRLDAASDEVIYFECNDLLPDGEWQRRLNDQAAILNDGLALRDRVSTHFDARYQGHSFEEWLRDIFDVPMRTLKTDHSTCTQHLERSQSRYARSTQ